MKKIGGLSGENEKKPGQVHVQTKSWCECSVCGAVGAWMQVSGGVEVGFRGADAVRGVNAVRAPIFSVFVQKIGWENTKTTDYFRGMGKIGIGNFSFSDLREKSAKNRGKERGRNRLNHKL